MAGTYELLEEAHSVFFFYALKNGLLARIDMEKLRFFFGLTSNPFFLSRRFPLYRRLNILKLLLSPRYACGVAEWLLYRVELYDGERG